ncbi:MAG: hypothetical protein HYR60_21030, partial [Acidobacteria bacterium]|nr:hypothetical protein [Acidobacteriota bacterium]
MAVAELTALYATLPKPARDLCQKAATALLAPLLGAAWQQVSGRTPGAVFARICRQWIEELGGDAAAASFAAFEDFFADGVTREEVRKILGGRYVDVDLPRLEDLLREKFTWARCPAPKTPLIAQLDVWLQDLEVLLEDLPDYRGQVRRAI